MSDPQKKVFLSSTSRDLTTYRDVVTDVIGKMGLDPVIMEDFQPTRENPVQVCYDKVQQSELFVGIYAYRYGYVADAGMNFSAGVTDGETGITHMEYEWAIARGIPMMLFVVDVPIDKWNGDKDEDLSNLEAFKAHIMTQHVVGFFKSPDDLSTRVAIALHAALELEYERDTPGWIRPEGAPPPEHFAGRAAEINQIQAMLRDKVGAQVVVQGIGGVGKTALAKYMAQRLGRDYFGGALWAELGPSLTEPGSVQTFTFERWKNVTPEGQAADMADVKPEHIRAWLSKAPGPLLAVIDDVWDARALQPLLDVLPANTNLIITTRDAGVHPMGWRFELTHLLPQDALQILKGRLGLDDESHDDELSQIAELLGHHALAIDIAAAKLGTSSIGDAGKLIERLQRHRDGDNPFKELKLGNVRDTNLEAALALSYEPLDEEHQRYFRLLGTPPPGIDFARDMALAVWGIDAGDEDAEDALDLIVRVGLAGQDAKGRYILHNNLTYYARALMRRSDTDEEGPARERFQAAMIVIAEQFEDLPPEDWREHISADYPLIAYHADEFVSDIEKWLAAHKLPNLEAHALPDPLPKPGTDEAAQKLMQNALDYFYVGIRDYVRMRHIGTLGRSWIYGGLVAARLLDHLKAESIFLNELGNWNNIRGYKKIALDYCEAQLSIERNIGNISGAADALNNIGLIYSDLGQKQQALNFYQRALPIQRYVGNFAGEANTLNNLASLYADLGDKRQALDFFQQALPIQRTVGNRVGEATTLNNLASVYADLGDVQQAINAYQQALRIQRIIGDRSGEAGTLNNIGMVYAFIGYKQQALNFYKQAVPILREVGNRYGEATTLNNIGMAYDRLGNKQQALKFFQDSLHIQRSIGDRSGEAVTLSNMGGVYLELGDKRRALEFLQNALPIQRAVGDRNGAAFTINNMSFLVDNTAEAIQLVEQAHDLWQAVQSPYVKLAEERLQELREGN